MSGSSLTTGAYHDVDLVAGGIEFGTFSVTVFRGFEIAAPSWLRGTAAMIAFLNTAERGKSGCSDRSGMQLAANLSGKLLQDPARAGT